MAANKQIYSCTNTAENRCGKAWTWELGLEQATLVLTQPKIVVVKRERGSLDLSQTIIINYLRILQRFLFRTS